MVRRRRADADHHVERGPPGGGFCGGLQDRRGIRARYQFNLWLVNPQELANFQVIYGDRWKAVLQSWGGVDMFASNLVTAGSAYVVAERQVGEMRFEKPLSTATWREEERETTWYRRPCDRCSR